MVKILVMVVSCYYVTAMGDLQRKRRDKMRKREQTVVTKISNNKSVAHFEYEFAQQRERLCSLCAGGAFSA